jgi:hypothetical protein
MIDAENRVEWRTIPAWPYQISSHAEDPQVWRMPTLVPGKGGSMRQIAARPIAPAGDSRVCPSRPGERRSFHPLRDLYPIIFPDLLEKRRRAARVRQALCRRGHPLMEPVEREVFGSLAARVKPKLAHWGTDNRLCRWCCDDVPAFDTHTYSPQYGVALPRYSSLPAKPRPRVVLNTELLNKYGLYTDNFLALEINAAFPQAD